MIMSGFSCMAENCFSIESAKGKKKIIKYIQMILIVDEKTKKNVSSKRVHLPHITFPLMLLR